MAKQNIKDPGAHHNSSGALIRRFLPYLAKHKAVLFLDLFCAALTTLCDIFLPKIMSTITNSAMGVGITLTTGIVLKLAGIYFVLRIIDGAAQYFMSGIGHIMGVHIETDMRRDAFDHLLLLVDLDRIDSFIDPFVSGLFDGFGEALVQKADLGVEDVSDPQQNRHVHAAFLHAPDDVHQTDGRGTRFPKRCHGHFAVVVDCEVSGTPVVDSVKVCGIANGPPFQRFSANVHFPILSIFIHRSVKSKVSEV